MDNVCKFCKTTPCACEIGEGACAIGGHRMPHGQKMSTPDYDVAPAKCPSCGVPYTEHAGLIQCCAETRRMESDYTPVEAPRCDAISFDVLRYYAQTCRKTSDERLAAGENAFAMQWLHAARVLERIIANAAKEPK